MALAPSGAVVQAAMGRSRADGSGGGGGRQECVPQAVRRAPPWSSVDATGGEEACARRVVPAARRRSTVVPATARQQIRTTVPASTIGGWRDGGASSRRSRRAPLCKDAVAPPWRIHLRQSASRVRRCRFHYLIVQHLSKLVDHEKRYYSPGSTMPLSSAIAGGARYDDIVACIAVQCRDALPRIHMARRAARPPFYQGRHARDDRRWARRLSSLQ